MRFVLTTWPRLASSMHILMRCDLAYQAVLIRAEIRVDVLKNISAVRPHGDDAKATGDGQVFDEWHDANVADFLEKPRFLTEGGRLPTLASAHLRSLEMRRTLLLAAFTATSPKNSW